MSEELKVEHELLIHDMMLLYNRVKKANLVRTTRAMNDALRLIHWESAIIFDKGYVPKRRNDVYDSNIQVLTVDDEVVTI